MLSAADLRPSIFQGQKATLPYCNILRARHDPGPSKSSFQANKKESTQSRSQSASPQEDNRTTPRYRLRQGCHSQECTLALFSRAKSARITCSKVGENRYVDAIHRAVGQKP